jgi:tetratricopeptide (TPR) repeat protein
MLGELKIRPVVIPQPQETALPVTLRDQFVLDGEISPLGFLLRSVVVLQKDQALEIANRLIRGVISGKELPGSVEASVPLSRVFDLQSLIGMYVLKLSIAGQSDEQRTAIIRLFLRYPLMTMLYRDGHQAAKRIALRILDIGDLLLPTENEQIAKMYKGVAFNFVTTDGDLSEALRALRIARKFDSADSSIIAMQIILDLKLKRLEDASDLVAQFEGATRDRALRCWLKADYCMAAERPEEAITLFEEAIALEENEEYQKILHFRAAFAYGMAEGLSPRQQGDGMIRHLEEALLLEENPVYHVLKGYGWALRGDLKQFEAEFAKTAILVDALDEQSRAGVKPFVENWKARGLRKLGQSSKVADNVLSIIGSPEESHDVANLMVLTGAALDLAGIQGVPEHLAAAERYVNRVIKLENANGEAFKYRALIHTVRGENATDSAEQALAREKAREDFLMSIRLGHELPESHSVLARLYEIAGDPVNAAKHRRRWLAIAPDDPDAIAYQALTILDQTGDIAKAEAYLESLDGKSTALGKIYRLVAAQALGTEERPTELLEATKKCTIKALALGDQEPVTSNLLAVICMELGTRYQAAGQLDAARDNYVQCLEVAPTSLDARTNLTMMYQVAGQVDEAADGYIKWLEIDPTSFTAHTNLAFILFDRDKYEEALGHWEQALQTSPDDADANAGKAAALHALGKEEEALSCYKTAVASNNDFLDEEIMRDKYLWSDKALGAVKAFITELKNKAT